MRSITRDLPPIGLQFFSDAVAIVATDVSNGAPFIRGARVTPIGDDQDRPLKELHATAVRQALAEMGVGPASCILSVQANEVVVRRFRVEPKSKENDVRAAAALEADEFCDWGVEDRVLALDPLAGTPDRMLSVARRDIIDQLIETAKECGLRPAAIDVPLAAWQRSLCDRADALLDVSHERPAMFLFAEPMGEQRLLPPRLSVEKLAQAVRTAIVDARRQRTSMVRSLQIWGEYAAMPQLMELLAQDRGLEVSEVKFGTHVNPRWGYAAALATWSFAQPPKGAR